MKNLLFDNHFTIVRQDKIENTFKDENIKLYDQIVLLQASISEIEKRILNDPIKERIKWAHDIEFIEKHQKVEQERAYFLSKKYWIDIIVILNNDLNKTIQEIEDFII